MEQRKLIQHGVSSLTLALPIKWLKERGLAKGDTLNVKVEGNNLVISSEEAVKLDKITANVTGLDRTSLLLYVQSLYRFGYNEVQIMYGNPIITHYRTGETVSVSSVVHLIINRLIGFEVVEQAEGKITLKYLIKESQQDFKVILRRIFLLIDETAKSLIEGIKKMDMHMIEAVDERHDNINKFVNYSLRLLNKYGYPDVKKTSFYYHIIASLDKIVDVLKYNARDFLKYKKAFSKESLEIWEEINQSIRGYYQLFYDFDMKKVNMLSRNRDTIKNRIKSKIKKLPVEEIYYLTSMKQILEIILDLTDFRMGLEY